MVRVFAAALMAWWFNELVAFGEPPQTTDQLLREFASVKYSWQQGDVAKKLVHLNDLSVVPKIEQYLVSESRQERCNAGLILAGLRDERGPAVIIKVLHDHGARPTMLRRSDGSPNLEGTIIEDRFYAAVLLGQLKSPMAVSALIDATNDNSINYLAAISLGQIGDRNAIPSLLAMSTNFPNQRIWAGYGLAQLEEPIGLNILTETLKSADWVSRRHAVQALGDIGNRRIVPVLTGLLHDKTIQVRLSTAIALGKLGDPDSLSALQEAFVRASENATLSLDSEDLAQETQFKKSLSDAIDLIHAKSKS